VADGIIFEKLGVQAASLVTDAFKASGDAMARLMGVPAYRYAMLPHPVANLTPDECRARAAEHLGEVLGILGLEGRSEQLMANRQRTPAEQVPWPAGGSV
jgi:hypothetical protein